MSVTVNRTSKRVIGCVSAIVLEHGDDWQGKPILKAVTYQRGTEVAMSAEEEARLDSLDALLPAGATVADADEHYAARSDAYRAERGDGEALARHSERLAASASAGGIVNIDAQVDQRPVAELAEWIKAEKPNAEDTVALAEGDSVRARKVLEAEHMATGGEPRQGVTARLTKLTGDDD